MNRRRTLALLGGTILVGGAVGASRLRGRPFDDGPRDTESPNSGIDDGTRNISRHTPSGDTTERRWQRVAQVVRALEAPVDYRDETDNIEAYDPARGAIFSGTTEGDLFLGDGSNWRKLPTPGTARLDAWEPASTTDRIERVDPAAGYRGLVDTLDTIGDAPAIVVVEAGRIDDVDGNVTVPSNTHLRGLGAAETTLAFADGADPDLAGLLRVEGSNVCITDLALDGNRENVRLGGRNLGQEYGIYTSGAEDVTIARVYCHDFPGYGIDPHADGNTPSRNVRVVDCVARRNGLDGITFAGVADGFAASNATLGNDRHGIAATDRQGRNVSIVNSVSAVNGGCGVVVQNRASAVTVAASVVLANDRDGLRIGNGADHVERVDLSNALIRNNGGYGVNVRPSRYVRLLDSDFETNNASGEADAEVCLTAAELPGSMIRIANNRFQVRPETDHAILERAGNGPTVVSGNRFDGPVQTPVALAHPASTARGHQE